jgi:hypothetical protein
MDPAQKDLSGHPSHFFVSVDFKWFSTSQNSFGINILADGLAGVDSKQLICSLIVWHGTRLRVCGQNALGPQESKSASKMLALQ